MKPNGVMREAVKQAKQMKRALSGTCLPMLLGLLGCLAVSLDAAAAVPPLGESPPVRRGIFLDADIGAAMTFGGKRLTDGAEQPSSPSIFLKLGAGYDVLDRLSVGAAFSLSAVGGRCLGQVTDTGGCIESATDWRGNAHDFTLAFVGAEAVWHQPAADRLFITAGAEIGWTFTSPSPRAGMTGAFSFGLAAGIEWMTPLDHFSIGADLGWNFLPGAGLHVLRLAPRIRYTF